MGVFSANRPAVGPSQPLQDGLQALNHIAGQVSRDKHLFHVCRAESIVGRIQFREVIRLAAKRIRIGDAMTPRPVKVDQTQNPGITIGPLKIAHRFFS